MADFKSAWCSEKKISFQLIVSNGLLAVIGILIGGIPAWLHTQTRIEEITTDL